MLNDKEGMVEMEEKEEREWNTRTHHAEGGVLKGRKAGGGEEGRDVDNGLTHAALPCRCQRGGKGRRRWPGTGLKGALCPAECLTAASALQGWTLQTNVYH